ncbi:MAG TPA: F0F1 ATP synthase subunit A [Planctomycetaceae bacterium]|nr:F0F1 ATP synthase subunit A [Planctomycetaceae bacterium]
MKPHLFEDPILFWIGTFPVTETMCNSTIVTLVVASFAALMGILVKRAPQNWLSGLAMWIVETLDEQVKQIVGHADQAVSTLAGALFLFIAGCNLAGQLPGVQPATANLTTSSALAAIVFFAVPIAGIRAHGVWKYVKHYFQPNPLLMPLHLLSEVSRTLALSIRLFGNVLSGHLIVAILVSLAGILVPTPLMALDLLIGLLQAYIFAVLATVYIGAAVSAGED